MFDKFLMSVCVDAYRYIFCCVSVLFRRCFSNVITQLSQDIKKCLHNYIMMRTTQHSKAWEIVSCSDQLGEHNAMVEH